MTASLSHCLRLPKVYFKNKFNLHVLRQPAHRQRNIRVNKQVNTIRYDTTQQINVRSKADEMASLI